LIWILIRYITCQLPYSMWYTFQHGPILWSCELRNELPPYHMKALKSKYSIIYFSIRFLYIFELALFRIRVGDKLFYDWLFKDKFIIWLKKFFPQLNYLFNWFLFSFVNNLFQSIILIWTLESSPIIITGLEKHLIFIKRFGQNW